MSIDDMSQRPAEPGERCTCGRPAVLVFLGGRSGPTGYCGIADGGSTAPCVFCGGGRHVAERCSQYQLKPGEGQAQ